MVGQLKFQDGSLEEAKSVMHVHDGSGVLRVLALNLVDPVFCKVGKMDPQLACEKLSYDCSLEVSAKCLVWASSQLSVCLGTLLLKLSELALVHMWFTSQNSGRSKFGARERTVLDICWQGQVTLCTHPPHSNSSIALSFWSLFWSF